MSARLESRLREKLHVQVAGLTPPAFTSQAVKARESHRSSRGQREAVLLRGGLVAVGT